MDFSWPLRSYSVMGGIVAAAITPGCHCAGGLAVSHCQLRVWINSRPLCFWRVWFKSAESAPGNTRAHRHAAGIGDLSHWTANMAKNPKARGMEIAGSSLPFRIAHHHNADQGSDRLCVSASWNSSFPMALW